MTSPVSITFEVDAKDVNARLAKFQDNTEAPRLPHFIQDDLAAFLQLRAEERFKNEGDDAVGAWAPLSAATENIRASKGFSSAHPINKRTGDLERFVTGSRGKLTSEGGGFGITFPDDPPSGDLSQKMITAQIGRPNPRSPARPVVGLSQVDEEGIMDLLSEYITKGLI